MLANMSLQLDSKSLHSAEAIPSTEMKNAHKKRLPLLLERKGFAQITRYGQVEYYAVSPKLFHSLVKAKSQPNAGLKRLKLKYDKMKASMQSKSHQEAFDRLSSASAEELNSSIRIP